MITNKLKNNDDNKELLIIGSPHTHSKHEFLVGKSAIKPSQCARTLGVVFDKQASMFSQVTNICKSANYHLCNIGAIREVITYASAKQLIHSLISAWLDYCNSPLTGLPDVQLKRLQCLQTSHCSDCFKSKKV